MNIEKKIIKPIVTEKGLSIEQENRYVFKVSMEATKGSIVKDLKDAFGVDVLEVNTMVMPGKKKRILKTYRFKQTQKWKKAVVKIKDGQKIDLFPKESKEK
jgi:large subunit ribosomal protein L23